MSNYVFNIEDFSFRYPYSDKIIHLYGDISIRKGETVLVSGPSGSGKSTLLFALKGLIPETIYGKLTGNVYYKGKPTAILSLKEQMQIGFLFQNPDAQMINRTVKQELALGMENLKISRKEMLKKINDYSKRFEITELLEREIRYLSGGEKQKIALVSILLMDPEVILFDEPTAFLDPDAARYYVETFNAIAPEKTIILIEHNRNYLEKQIDRVIKIDNNGKMEEKSLNETSWRKKFLQLNHISKGPEVLKIKNLSYAYKHQKNILKDINLNLKRGEIVSIIGKNGAGKSTLLKLIANQLKTNNSIFYIEKTGTIISDKNRVKHIALLLQNPENHFLFNSISQEINDSNIVEQIGLRGYEKRNPFTLSEGEKRRLSLGIQWSLDREIYLLDEPTFGQDEQNINGLIEMLDRMRRDGKSFLITSHDLEFVKAVSDKIYHLKDGSLVSE